MFLFVRRIHVDESSGRHVTSITRKGGFMVMHTRIYRRLLVVFLTAMAAFWLGCASDECPGKASCPCDDTQLCNDGLSCLGGTCQDPSSSGEKVDGDGGMADGGSADGQRCDEGSLACRCLTSGKCKDGLRCERGICRKCPEGTVGCACKGGKTCGTGLTCESGICAGCEGKTNCACYKNNSCDKGNRCFIQSNGQSRCEACDAKGDLLCNCEQDNDCDAKYICVNKRCALPAALSKIPKALSCYTPCQGNERKSDGSIVICDPKTKLKPGCEPGFACVGGSCVAASAAASKDASLSGKSYPFCLTSANCPSWQACIEGRCYSNCKSDRDCSSSESCHSYVCRRKCSVLKSDCSNGDSCQNVGSLENSGLCMPLIKRRSTTSERTETSEVFVLSTNILSLSNREPVGYFSIVNKSEFEATFQIVRAADSTTSKKPLSFLSFDVCKTIDETTNTCSSFVDKPDAKEPFALSIKGGERVILKVLGAEKAPDAIKGYTGYFLVKTGQTEQRVTMSYRRTGTGRWKGKLYSFGNFNDEELSQVRDKNVRLQVFKNALVRRWIDFKRNQITYEQFSAMLQAVREGTWQQTLTQQNCQRLFSSVSSPDVACYPSSSAKGYDILSDSQVEVPVPSGVSSLDFGIHVKELSANRWEGRIATSETLHFPGDPKISISFEGKPGEDKISYLSGLTAVSDLGGRYAASSSGGCVNADTTALSKLPWLVPGFVLGSTPLAGSLFREKASCRSHQLPLVVPEGASDEVKKAIQARNASLSSANPIPNGRVMRRSLALINGAVLDNKLLFALVKETFTSPFAATPGVPSSLSKSWSRYGYLWLRFVDDNVSDDDVKGNDMKVCTGNSQCASGESCEDGVCQPLEQSRHVSCSAEIVKAAVNAQISQSSELRNWSQVRLKTLAGALLGSSKIGNSAAVSALAITPTTSGELTMYSYPHGGKTHYIHYYCEDTKQFNGGPTNDPRDCPISSKVIFFSAPVSEEDIRKDTCQSRPDTPSSCDKRLVEIRTIPGYRENVPFRCKEASKVFCDTNRRDMRNGKVFYRPPTQANVFVSSLPPLRNALFEAFRYRIKFQSRSGKNVGFAPEICSQVVGSQIPYCYDPKVIEQIELRVSCLQELYTDKSIANKLDSATKSEIKNFLIHAFAFSNRKVNGVIFTDPGFETLNAELKVMLGDEAYTKALTSRYNLAATQLLKFEGDKLEPNGVVLSGVLGYEMTNLYLSVQYYQSVLDRFYAQTNTFAKSFQPGEAFLSGSSVTSYFQKLLLAATRKARSWGQIAKKYHSINRPDLAKHVLERAYMAGYVEQMLMTRLLHALTGVLERKQLPQLRKEIERVSLTFTSALLDMQETYEKVSRKLNLFGFPEGYVPFPALSRSITGTASVDAFRYVLFFAKEKVGIAEDKEQIALQTARSFDTSSARFQSELVKIETNYNEQLIQLCGEFKEGDKSVPATPKYAYLAPKQGGDPCGLVPGSALFNAYANLERTLIATNQLQHQFDTLNAQIDSEKARINKFCNDRFSLADITWSYNDKRKDLLASKTLEMLLLQQGLATVQKVFEIVQSRKCEAYLGTSASTECLGAHISTPIRAAVLAAETATVTTLSFAIQDTKREMLALQSDFAKINAKSSCNICPLDDPNCASGTDGVARIQSQNYLAQLALELLSFKHRRLTAQYNTQLAMSQIQGLQQRVQRLIKEQEDALAMLNNVTAAANDPNQRIYKNDAVINAERTFEDALREAYRATLVYEYYTSQSYARKSDLYLVRMIGQGDINLSNYLGQLERAFLDFEEKNGKADTRVLVMSLKDDILKIPKQASDGSVLVDQDRAELFLKALADPKNYNESGIFRVSFNISVDRESPYVSPVTFNHKVLYIEAEIKATEHGDNRGYVYVRQDGTGTVRKDEDTMRFYALPQRTGVINAFFNGFKGFEPSVYRNYRLQDRPLGNTQWSIMFNQANENANKDIKLNSINDIILYIYYTDFSKP